jgi:hypothetical protein
MGELVVRLDGSMNGWKNRWVGGWVGSKWVGVKC